MDIAYKGYVGIYQGSTVIHAVREIIRDGESYYSNVCSKHYLYLCNRLDEKQVKKDKELLTQVTCQKCKKLIME